MLDPVTHRDWTLKSYAIVYGDHAFDASHFVEGQRLALAGLPEPAVTPDRAGVGFLIAHQGNNINYLVLGWWDRENELPLRVFVSDPGDAGPWRAARDAESVCVWDLQVIWSEREAYVATIMSSQAKDAPLKYIRQSGWPRL
jgi:hypothetical protein